MKKEYKKILNLLEEKIETLDSLIKSKKIQQEKYLYEREKLCKLYKLINDKYHNFFSEIAMQTAINILEDIGISQQESIEVYKKLITEDMDENYVLIDNIEFEKMIENNK